MLLILPQLDVSMIRLIGTELVHVTRGHYTTHVKSITRIENGMSKWSQFHRDVHHMFMTALIWKVAIQTLLVVPAVVPIGHVPRV